MRNFATLRRQFGNGFAHAVFLGGDILQAFATVHKTGLDLDKPVNIDVKFLCLCPVPELLWVLTYFLNVNHIF